MLPFHFLLELTSALQEGCPQNSLSSLAIQLQRLCVQAVSYNQSALASSFESHPRYYSVCGHGYIPVSEFEVFKRARHRVSMTCQQSVTDNEQVNIWNELVMDSLFHNT
jgi:hypothetical protein